LRPYTEGPARRDGGRGGGGGGGGSSGGSGRSGSGYESNVHGSAADSRSGTAVARLAIPGGWDGTRLVAAGSGGVSLTLTRAVAAIELIDPTVLPLGGGLMVTVTGVDITAAPGDGGKAGRCGLTLGGACLPWVDRTLLSALDIET